MTTERGSRTLVKAAVTDCALGTAIRAYVRAYVQRYGRRQAAHAFGVSRYTLWRCLARGHLGRALPRAVLDPVGGSVEALEAATRELTVPAPARRSVPVRRPLPVGLEDALLLLCATPLATVRELSCIGRTPASTLRDRLAALAQQDLVGSVPHLTGQNPEPLSCGSSCTSNLA